MIETKYFDIWILFTDYLSKYSKVDQLKVFYAWKSELNFDIAMEIITASPMRVWLHEYCKAKYLGEREKKNI